MTLRQCPGCGKHFDQEEPWMRYCAMCVADKKFRAGEWNTDTFLYRLFRTAQRQLAETQDVAVEATGATLSRARVRQLLQLCHPDKHGGSKTATEITQWLLAIKGGKI